MPRGLSGTDGKRLWGFLGTESVNEVGTMADEVAGEVETAGIVLCDAPKYRTEDGRCLRYGPRSGNALSMQGRLFGKVQGATGLSSSSPTLEKNSLVKISKDVRQGVLD